MMTTEGSGPQALGGEEASIRLAPTWSTLPRLMHGTRALTGWPPEAMSRGLGTGAANRSTHLPQHGHQGTVASGK